MPLSHQECFDGGKTIKVHSIHQCFRTFPQWCRTVTVEQSHELTYEQKGVNDNQIQELESARAAFANSSMSV
jgi:hypothetical protein